MISFKIASSIHWLGFTITAFLLILSALDPSKDEMVIHFIASIIPNTICWALAMVIDGKRGFFPFLYTKNKI